MGVQLVSGPTRLAKQDTLLSAKMPVSDHPRFAARTCKQGLGTEISLGFTGVWVPSVPKIPTLKSDHGH